MADTQANDNSTCVVCFKTVEYYSIGECDHPVCFECSTRMRVLCLQNECPICRQALARVVFTETVEPYKELRNRVFADRLFERQYKIGFSSEEIKRCYELLLENCCRQCQKLPPFRSFGALSDHMRKVHERYYCDLCVKHLKIFTSERRCYTRQELAHHRRKGDLDDTSHRGHPLCEFCEERFMDADELYRHLRKEHLYCHLCDADGRNHYYASHAALAHHFRADHHLCEEGECAGQHLTAVFRSEIDLIAHKASIHGKGLTRTAARQARTLELQFNITPHAPQRTPRDSRQQQREEPPPSPPPAQPPPPRIDTRSDAHFPRLSAAAPAPLVLGAVSRVYKGPDGLARTNRNFPALDGGNSSKAPAPPAAPAKPAAAAILRNSKPSVSIQLHGQPASASSFRLTQPTGHRISAPPQQRRQPLDDDDFPTLGLGAANDNHPSLGAGTVQPPKVAMINSQEMQALKKAPNHQTKKAPMGAEAFPALSASSAPTSAPQWVKISKSKEKVKPAKAESPPPRQPNFNPVADFPTLPVNQTKPKPKHVTPPQPARKPAPAPQIPSSQPDGNKVTKKEKKKNNIKKENLLFEDHNYEYLNDKKIVRDLAHVLSNVNNNQSDSAPVEHRNIKTVADTSAGAAEPDKPRNGGNGDFKLAAKDYPALGKADASKKFAAPKRMPNGAVPPGFTKPRPACDGMTFTNSAGQTFPAPVHTYIPPPEFESRNRALVQKFAAALGSPAAFEDFKVASRAFRDSVITANEFYQHCQAALGSRLDCLLLELVALLPDIAKQQELVVGRKIGDQLDMCTTCGQLLTPVDNIAHDTAHWPPLSG